VNPKESSKADAMTMKLMKPAAVVCVLVLFSIAAMAQGSATGNLSGVVKDPKGAVVANATVSARNDANGIPRETSTNASGAYQILNLPPGDYIVSATANASGLSPFAGRKVTVNVGGSTNFNIELGISVKETETVTAGAAIIETERTATATTITQERITNLPINGRNFLSFTLTDSSVKRDDAPSIGAAPTSGANFNGQRARGNLIVVDGMDAIDNSTNGVRSTVSQDAVQEFQIVSSNANAEYGRAAGGVVNIVSRSGTNKMHGTAFGFLRSNAVDATNPFSTIADPSYTRTQYGFTVGGPIKQSKTFYFFSFEGTRRQETGFTSIGRDCSGSSSCFGYVPFDAGTLIGVPGNPAFQTMLTPTQISFLQANPGATSFNYALFADQARTIALDGPAATNAIGYNSFLPGLFAGVAAPLPTSFVPMRSLIGNYPIAEKTDTYSLKLDHNFSDRQQILLRFSGTPSKVSGIQVNGQNQVFGQNSFSRTSRQDFTDLNVVAGDTWNNGSHSLNELRFQYARRRLGYDPANTPTGQQVAVNIPGVAFFGREPFSFVHRTEERYQALDNFTWVHGTHTLKFGVDVNHLPINADFTVNFGGLYNFGSIAASSIPIFPANYPSFDPVQAYGLGLPQVFVQGVGNPHDSFSNNTVGLYLQDSWHARHNLIVNYGLRYDAEYTPTFKPVNAISAAAQDKLGITQGIPRDLDNIAPRIGIAWDPWSDGKTVVRAGWGIYYDHPLLGLAFDSDITDGSQAPQLAFFGGAPGVCQPTGSNLNAANLFMGVFDGSCIGSGTGNFGYLNNQQRFDSGLPNSVFVNQNYLSQGVPLSVQPFGFPVAKNFKYAYSHQINLGFEHDMGHDFAVSFNYNANLGRNLNRPVNANPVNTEALITNWERAVAAGFPITTNPLAITGCGNGPLGIFLPSAYVSFFRGNGGINPSLAPIFSGCDPLVAAAGGIANSNVPFSDMIANYSTGSSNYHGLTTTIRKRMGGGKYEFLLSHTWSHAIDDSTDLQSLLAPQDSRFGDEEKATSTFDQRHRLVLSGVYQSRSVGAPGSAKHAILSGWTVAPILEWSSGRPFNILTGSDNNFDLSSNTDRPVIVPGPGVSNCGDAAVRSIYSPSGWIQPACFFDGTIDGIASGQLRGNLGRNTGRRPHTIFNDVRISKEFKIGERMHVEGMMDIFNAWNRLNVADVNVIWTDAGKPTASFDPRQIQFGVKLNW
jgi:hypothetical protein